MALNTAEEAVAFTRLVGFPVIVKPNFGDSSFGITQRSVAYSVEQLVNAIVEIRATRYKDNQPVPGSGQRWIIRFGI